VNDVYAVWGARANMVGEEWHFKVFVSWTEER